jgi:putative toxin-antitoxin system antitoxin component (TIGR02293 family)
MNPCALAKVLGGEKVLGRKVSNTMDLVELSRQGVSKKALSKLADYLGLGIPAMAPLLPITLRTLQRYKAKDHFKPSVSGHILELADLVASGTAVFSDRKRFLEWMNRPNKALGNEAPMKILDSTFGVRMVRDELGRIEHGVIS